MRWFPLAVVLALCGCPRDRARNAVPAWGSPTTTRTTTRWDGGTALPEGPTTVILHPRQGDPATLTVTVARTAQQRARGTAGHAPFGPGEGYLYYFPIAEAHVVWTRGTMFPVDMIYIDTDRRVLGVIRRAPVDSNSVPGVPGASPAVLVAPAGFADAHHIAVGDAVEFRDLGPPPNA